MESELNDIVSPSQSSPSMSSGPKPNSTVDPGNATMVSWAKLRWNFNVYKWFHRLFQLLTKPRLQELVREVDPNEQLDEEVEDCLLQIADEFVENVINGSCLIAKHRIHNGPQTRDNKVEVKDVQLYLERHWNLWIPGFGTEELRPYKRTQVTEAHKQRCALIRKALKKYWIFYFDWIEWRIREEMEDSINKIAKLRKKK